MELLSVSSHLFALKYTPYFRPVFADATCSAEALELTDPHGISPQTTETILFGSRDMKPSQLELPRLTGKQVIFRLFTTGKNSELTAEDLIDTIKSDMLFYGTGLTPVIETIAWKDPIGTKYVKLRHSMEHSGLDFINFRVSGSGPNSLTGIGDLQFANGEWRAEDLKGRFDVLYRAKT